MSAYNKNNIVQNYSFVVTCEALANLKNGHISYNEFPVTNKDIMEKVQISYNEFSEEKLSYTINTTASFRCNHGFLLSGSESSTCETFRNWSHQIPVCEQGKKLTNSFVSHT